jgi:hypothetical protein
MTDVVVYDGRTLIGSIAGIPNGYSAKDAAGARHFGFLTRAPGCPTARALLAQITT